MNDELAKKYAATVSEQIKDFTKDKSCVLYTCINLTRKTTAVGTMYEETHKDGLCDRFVLRCPNAGIREKKLVEYGILVPELIGDISVAGNVLTLQQLRYTQGTKFDTIIVVKATDAQRINIVL